jgi:hypothetical protein
VLGWCEEGVSRNGVCGARVVKTKTPLTVPDHPSVPEGNRKLLFIFMMIINCGNPTAQFLAPPQPRVEVPGDLPRIPEPGLVPQIGVLAVGKLCKTSTGEDIPLCKGMPQVFFRIERLDSSKALFERSPEIDKPTGQFMVRFAVPPGRYQLSEVVPSGWRSIMPENTIFEIKNELTLSTLVTNVLEPPPPPPPPPPVPTPRAPKPPREFKICPGAWKIVCIGGPAVGLSLPFLIDRSPKDNPTRGKGTGPSPSNPGGSPP